MPAAKATTASRRRSSYTKSGRTSSSSSLEDRLTSLSRRLLRKCSSNKNRVDDRDDAPVTRSKGPRDRTATSSSSDTSKSTEASLDVDAAPLSSTLIMIHQNTEAWHTGNWDADAATSETETSSRDDANSAIPETKSRSIIARLFSLSSVTACCGQIDDASIDEAVNICREGGGEGLVVPREISRGRSGQRAPELEIECTLQHHDEEGREAVIHSGDPDEHYSENNHAPPSDDKVDSSFIANSTVADDAMASFPPPSQWTHFPLLLTATPGSGTVIRRIRRVDDHIDDDSMTDCLPLHAQLPINNGRETHAVVLDFETPSFVGTALFRIRDSGGTEETNGNDNTARSGGKGTDYFATYNRKFQMVIQGKFKRPDVVMADCMSGMMLDGPLRTAGSPMTDPLLACADGDMGSLDTNVHVGGRNKRNYYYRNNKKRKEESLPPKWVLRASVKIAGLFSPRMDADLECARPRILSPLCSMAQSLHVDHGDGERPALEAPHVEPNHSSNESLVRELGGGRRTIDNGSSSSVQIRKKAFDAVYDRRISQPLSSNASPCFDTDATYTFEFLQHLIDYNDFSLDFGSIVGKMKLGGALRGQPCRFVAGVTTPRSGCGRRANQGQSSSLTLRDLDCLWSFDLWHESLHVET